jgi:hypothetical protein
MRPLVWCTLAFAAIRWALLGFGVGASESLGELSLLLAALVATALAALVIMERKIPIAIAQSDWFFVDMAAIGYLGYLFAEAMAAPNHITLLVQLGGFRYDLISISAIVFLIVAIPTLILLYGPKAAPFLLIVSLVLFDLASCVVNTPTGINWFSPYMNANTVLWEGLLILPLLFGGFAYAPSNWPYLGFPILANYLWSFVHSLLPSLNVLSFWVASEPAILVVSLVSATMLLKVIR